MTTEVETTPVEIPELTWGTGRRKTSIARVRLKPGEGAIMVNGKPFDEYFPTDRLRNLVVGPLRATGLQSRVDVLVNVKGGGLTGQAGATAHGIARALDKAVKETHIILRKGGFLTRDSRMVERKKYGRRGARRGFQFSKR